MYERKRQFFGKTFFEILKTFLAEIHERNWPPTMWTTRCGPESRRRYFPVEVVGEVTVNKFSSQLKGAKCEHGGFFISHPKRSNGECDGH